MDYVLIGCGRIAANHLRAAEENGLSIVGVCDLIPERMEDLLARCGRAGDATIPRYTDYRRMLEERRPALAAVATESGTHAAIALDCIDRGCNVIVEKPIALSLEDADEINRRAGAKGVKVAACHQNRFNQSIRHIRHALDQGRFGRLSHGSVHVRWNRDQDYYRQAPWRGTWAQDGGALMNQCIHGIDLLRWLMGGCPEEVFAYTRRRFHPYLECEDLGLALVRFQGGAVGSIEGTTNVFPENLEETLYLFGENGTVKAGGKSVNTLELWRFAQRRPEDGALEAGLEEPTANVYGNGHRALYADMVDAVRTGREPFVTGEDGRNALELVLAIYRSAAQGRPVRLPMERCSTREFEGLFP